MDIFDLGSAPAYHALSYTWGSSFPTQTILVNSGYLSIGGNLFKFCQEFCRGGFSISGSSPDNGKAHDGDEDKAVYFWIDQLCINQADTSERNHQVSQMRDIYSGALMTVMWLHDELNSLRDIRENVDAEIPITDIRFYKIYKRIISHTYFSRLWIIQEILLAKKVGENGPWFDIVRDSFIPEPRGLKLVPTLSKARDAWGNAVLHDPRNIIVPYCQNECSDPKDKVYGLMALIGQEFRIPVDYDKSVYQILFDILQMVSRLPSEFAYSSPNLFGENTRMRLLAVVGSQLGLTHVQHNGWLSFIDSILGDTADRWGMLLYDTAQGWNWETYDTDAAQPTTATLSFEHNSNLVEHWWYECRGERHSFLCLPLSALKNAPTTLHTRPDDPKQFFGKIDLDILAITRKRNLEQGLERILSRFF